ncbi:MAG: hypothetical protein NT007_13235 [Candidatus Kapabacteria bacterium]|nr:hypothetical protein [Candidatus Kapabacteria bacterium]
MTKSFYKYIFLLLFSLCFILNFAFAKVHRDNKGTDFWMTFPPNYHNSSGNETDTLYLYIASSNFANVKITYANILGKRDSIQFQVTDTNQVYLFDFDYRKYELTSFMNSNGLISNNDNEKISKKSFHITSDQEIVLFAHSQANYTSDGSVILPTKAIANEYYILAWPCDGAGSNFGLDERWSTPSQFAIVATEDSTLVRIFPSCATKNFGINRQDVLLKTGEVYLVQANIDVNHLNNDLTGTRISSSKPIAVFAGQQRTVVPIMDVLSSRDFLFEQIFPINTWGRNAFLLPYPHIQGESNISYDVFRILAAYDSTLIYIDSVFVKRLNEGEFYQDSLVRTAFVQSNYPVLVGQYRKTSQDTANDNMYPYPDSDPFFTLIPPREQFLNAYTVFNIQAYEGGTAIYNFQYLSIVCPQKGCSYIKLDGNLIDLTKFKKVGKSDYMYYNLRVNDRVHRLESDTTFGLYVFGYGNANSYGYVGGMNFDPYDYVPPRVTTTSSCDTMKVVVADSIFADTFLRKVYVPDTSKINVAVQFGAYSPSHKSIGFEVSLIDKYQDGHYTVLAIDSSSNQTERTYDIPGFTVRTLSQIGPSIPAIDTSCLALRPICFNVILTNYGKFNQDISNIFHKDTTSYFTVTGSGKTVLKPGEIEILQICFTGKHVGLFFDTLLINSKCLSRTLFYFSINVTGDINKPKIESQEDQCSNSYKLKITDILSTDYGIASIDTIVLKNIFIDRRDSLPFSSYFQFKIIDLKQDAEMYIKVSDSVGNVNEYHKIIPGFTLEINGSRNDNFKFIYKDVPIGSYSLDTIKLKNYGNFEIEYKDIPLIHNLFFSIPQSQFPIVLSPQSEKSLEVLFHPLWADTIPVRDTVILTMACLEKNIVLEGTSIPVSHVGDGTCEIPANFNTIALSNRIYIEQISWQSDYVYNFSIISSQIQAISVSVFDIFANRILSEKYDITKGRSILKIPINEMESGVYVLKCETINQSISKSFIIIK